MLNINEFAELIRGTEFYEYEEELNEVINDEVDFFLNEIGEKKYQFVSDYHIVFFNENGDIEEDTKEEEEIQERLDNVYCNFIAYCEEKAEDEAEDEE